VDVIRSLISCALLVGLGTGLVVGALLVVLPSVRIASAVAATDGSIVVRAVLVDDVPDVRALAAPEAWRRCPYLAAVAAEARCPYLAAVAAGSGCPYLRGNAGRSTCPFLRSSPGSVANRAPGAGDESRGLPSDGAVLARLEPAATDQRPAGQI
jgi:hypothetical protein